MKIIKLLIAVISLTALFTQLNAQENNHDQQNIDHPKKHNEHKHHVAVFGGGVTNFIHKETQAPVGIDCEYRLSYAHNKFGVGVLAEYIPGKSSEILFGLPIFYHLGYHLKFVAAPMLAILNEHEVGDTHGNTEPKQVNEFDFRIGGAYDFHLKHLSVSPTVNFDFTSETTALVYGVSIGMGF